MVDDPVGDRITVSPGAPCQREDLAAAQAAGDLQILVPIRATDADLRAFGTGLAPLSESPASRGAWQLKVAPAVARATARLQANCDRGNYTFPQLLVIDSPFWGLEPPEPEWVEDGIVWRARTSPGRAIEGFYDKVAVAECYAAQLVAVFAVQYEVHGPESFDQAFRPEEVQIGKPPAVQSSPFGSGLPRCDDNPRRALFLEAGDTRDPFVVLALAGPKAFAGVPGILRDQDRQKYCNENFVLVSMSPAATALLAREGGLEHIRARTAEALGEFRAARSPFATAASIEASQARMREILASPVFTGMRMYIHPYGIVTLGEMVVKKLERMNAAIEVFPYLSAREEGFYRRYRLAFLRRWRDAHDPQASSSGS